MRSLHHVTLCLVCATGLFVLNSACLFAELQVEFSTDVLLHQAVNESQNPMRAIESRKAAIRTLRAFAEQYSFSDSTAQTPIVSPDQADLAMQTILTLLKDANHDIVDDAAFQAWLALKFEGTSTQVSLTPENRRKAQLVVMHFPSLVRCNSASDSTRRRSVEKLSETAELLREFHTYYKAHVQSELDIDKPNLDQSLAQIRLLIGELTKIREHFSALLPDSRMPTYAIVASNLLDALVADKDLRKGLDSSAPTTSIGTSGAASGATASSNSLTVDTAMQPIAASSIPSAIGMGTVSSDAKTFAVSTRLLGVATTGSFSVGQRSPGARGDYLRTAGQSTKVSQSRRSALRVPGETLNSTADAARVARSRGASGSNRTGRATGAAPIAQPTQAKPAAPASPATIPVAK